MSACATSNRHGYFLSGSELRATHSSYATFAHSGDRCAARFRTRPARRGYGPFGAAGGQSELARDGLGYEVEDLGNIPVEQAESCAEGDAHAKYLAQIAAACERLGTQVIEALERGGCRWCWAATIR